MLTGLENRFFDIATINVDTRQQLALCVAADRTLRDVLKLAAARLHMADSNWKLDSLQIRREGELLPLDSDALVGKILRSGDRLIVERSMRAGRDAGTGREAVAGDDAFRSAAARIAGGAVSPDSATFLGNARQPIGE